MRVKINCKGCDHSDYYRCNLKPKRFGLFRQGCVEAFSNKTCDIAQRIPRPKAPPPPPRTESQAITIIHKMGGDDDNNRS